MKTIYSDGKTRIDLDPPWIYLNERKYGFITQEGVYCHRNQAERFNKEFGFHIPKHLIHMDHIFEVKTSKDPAVYLYTVKNKQRMLYTDPLIFVSLARLIPIPKAHHVPRPRKPTARKQGEVRPGG